MKDKESKRCSLVVTRNKKRLTGTAAQIAHISECGGWDAFLRVVADQIVGNFAQAYNEAARRPRLYVVGEQNEKMVSSDV